MAAFAPPLPRPQREGVAHLPGAALYYWDTGGDGEAVVLLHPFTGSAHVWPFQQPVFAGAGYRVIGYSRRGFAGSEAGPPADPGTGAGDLHALLDVLGVERCHAVASAAGAFVALDFALSFPERVISQVLASSFLGLQEEDAKALIARIMPPNFQDLPPEFRELGPSYRAANPQGVQAWLALEHGSGAAKFRQPTRNVLNYAALEKLSVPTLLVTGEADLFAPPPLQRLFLSHMPKGQLRTLPECGHSAYWEQPELFNQVVLDFLGKHRL